VRPRALWRAADPERSTRIGGPFGERLSFVSSTTRTGPLACSSSPEIAFGSRQPSLHRGSGLAKIVLAWGVGRLVVELIGQPLFYVASELAFGVKRSSYAEADPNRWITGRTRFEPRFPDAAQEMPVVALDRPNARVVVGQSWHQSGKLAESGRRLLVASVVGMLFSPPPSPFRLPLEIDRKGLPGSHGG
jgi:hypothetical protein